MPTTVYGWKTIVGTLILAGLGVYLLFTPDTSTWGAPNAGVNGDILRSDGRLCLVLAFVFFGLRSGMARILRELQERTNGRS